MKVVIDIETKEAANDSQKIMHDAMSEALLNYIDTSVGKLLTETLDCTADCFGKYRVYKDEGIGFFELHNCPEVDKALIAERLSERLECDIQYIPVIDKFSINVNPISARVSFLIAQNIPTYVSAKILSIDPESDMHHNPELAGLSTEESWESFT